MQNDKNIALNRPANQSSTSPWSTSQTPMVDAQVGNNGDLSGEKIFHTKAELNPWWEVDLGDYYSVESIRLYNRVEAKDRLRNFTVLRSSDYATWFPVVEKQSDELFDDITLKADEAGVARYVRVRLNGFNCLHFRELQVFGRLLDLSEKEDFERRDIKRESKRADIFKGREGHLATIGAYSVFVDEEKYGKKVQSALTSGRYENRERALVTRYVKNTDRVIEAGTAIGAVTMTAAAIVGAANVHTFDANPYIVKDAKANFAFNDLADIDCKPAVLVSRKRYSPGTTHDFHISKEFWASRLFVDRDTSDIVETVKVESRCLEDEIESHNASVLICDIEGGEIDLLSSADLSKIRLIIMEVHYKLVGEEATDKMIHSLYNQGLYLDVDASGNGVIILRRHQASIPA